jgi:hypothetical protein
MKLNLKTSLFAAIAMLTGFVVLIGYFVEIDFLTELRHLMVNWAVLLAAVAIIVGVINLARVHWHRVKSHQSSRFNSLVLVSCMLGTLIVTAYFGPISRPSMFIFNNILAPIEMSLMALLMIVLLMASIKLLRQRLSGHTLLFLGVVILVILGSVSLPGIEYPIVYEVKNWVAQTWAGAGARGILLGVALGIVATGIRILLGVERPYSD